jgi:hypothetical protein
MLTTVLDCAGAESTEGVTGFCAGEDKSIVTEFGLLAAPYAKEEPALGSELTEELN